MTLVVEDGSISNPAANTYVSRADYITYAATVGVTITDNAAVDIQLIKAANFLETMRPRFKGTLVDRDQPLAWNTVTVYFLEIQ